MAHETSRRTLLKTATAIPAATAAFAQTPTRPNILIVLTDDHSTPHLGCYGDPVLRTPDLDALAANGIRFNRAYTTAPQCSPSRASIFTGHSPQRINMTRLATPLPPEHKIFPETLRENGYFTGVAGRWHHADGRARPRPWLAEVYKNHRLQTMADRVDFVGRGGQNAVFDELNGFFSEKPKDKPFFLQVSFNDTHRRWDKNEYSARFDPARMPVPDYLPDLPAVREDLTRYYGEIERADETFGRILEDLKRRGVAENTIVMFMGDNGHALPHGKGTLYQPGWHVPLLVSWPGRVKAGSVTEELISGVDIAPTLLGAAGIQPPEEMEGRSFLNLLEGKPYEGRKYVFGSRGWHNHLDLIRSVSTKTHSLIYNCTPNQPHRPVDYGEKPIWSGMQTAHREGRLADGFEQAYFSPTRPVYEMFDLERDPREFDNLAGKPEYAKLEFELKSALNDWMEATYDYLPPPFPYSQDLHQHAL